MSVIRSTLPIARSPQHPILIHQCLAEVLWTFVLVFFGIGSVHAAVITGAQVGVWQVPIVWGIGIALAIYATSAVSGAHLNPAITLALAAYRGDRGISFFTTDGRTRARYVNLGYIRNGSRKTLIQPHNGGTFVSCPLDGNTINLS